MSAEVQAERIEVAAGGEIVREYDFVGLMEVGRIGGLNGEP